MHLIIQNLEVKIYVI